MVSNPDQPNFGFPEVIPPARALVKASRRSRARELDKSDVDVVDVTANAVGATDKKVGDAVVNVEATAKVDNPIVVPPTSAPPPAQQARLPTPQQHVEAIPDNLTALAATYDVHHSLEWDERGGGRSDLRVKRRVVWWSRKRTWFALIVVAVVAGVAGSNSWWLPWAKAKLSPPVVMPPMHKPEIYGPPAPAPSPPKNARGRQTKKEPKPTWWKQLGKDLGIDN